VKNDFRLVFFLVYFIIFSFPSRRNVIVRSFSARDGYIKYTKGKRTIALARSSTRPKSTHTHRRTTVVALPRAISVTLLYYTYKPRGRATTQLGRSRLKPTTPFATAKQKTLTSSETYKASDWFSSREPVRSRVFRTTYTFHTSGRRGGKEGHKYVRKRQEKTGGVVRENIRSSIFS